MLSFAKILFSFIVVFFKSMFNAVVTIAFGIASFFLLGGLIKAYNQIPPAELMYLVGVIMDNWRWFFLIIWLFNLIVDYKELTKGDKK